MTNWRRLCKELVLVIDSYGPEYNHLPLIWRAVYALTNDPNLSHHQLQELQLDCCYGGETPDDSLFDVKRYAAEGIAKYREALHKLSGITDQELSELISNE